MKKSKKSGFNPSGIQNPSGTQNPSGIQNSNDIQKQAVDSVLEKNSDSAVPKSFEPPLTESARLLGFGLEPFFRSKINKVLKEKDGFVICELKSGERKYFVKGFPSLSVSEALAVSSVLSEFQSSQDKKSGKTIEFFLDEYCLKNNLELEQDQAKYLLAVVEKLAFGLGPLDELLKNDDIEEIGIVGLHSPVRVFEKGFGWLSTNLFFENEKTVKNLANKMARPLGRRLSMQTPRINAVLSDGSRLHAAIEPVSFSGPVVTIRKFRQKPFTPLDLALHQTITLEALAFLWLVLETDCSVLVCGNTGSGKTTTLNALFGFVPQNERIVIVEETPEMRVPHVHQVRLSASEELGVSMQSLILDSLRMRPDRVVIGEIRSAIEVKAFVDTLLAGQGKGSFGTFHSQSAGEAVTRMRTMGVDEMDLASIGLIVVQRRWTVRQSDGGRREVRKVTEISEVELDNGALKLNLLFGYDFAQNKLVRENQSKTLEKKIMQSFGFGSVELAGEQARRMDWLSKASLQGLGWREFFEEANRYG
ncbi:MAG: ATPase, T2SS/T4P/T4SS family [Candidatus Micrarchaeota archaeon]